METEYIPIWEMRRRVFPMTLCGHCLAQAALWRRWLCGDCYRRKNLVAWQQTARKEEK